MPSPRVGTRILPFLAPRPRREKGVAIVLVLACIVILTGLVFAFFSRAITERQVASTSMDQSSADILARSAMDIIVGDLKQEIVDGSSPSPTEYKLYVPKSVPKSNAYVLPQTSGTPSPGPSTASPLIPNLVRRSVRNDPLADPSPPSPALHAVTTSASAVNSTTDVSANGRTISVARWNSHYLIPRLDTSTTIDSTPAAAFTPPDWVVVTSNGPKTIINPDTASVGRYAYAIYDEGGLLDLNVAGYPSSITPTQAGSKTTLAFADLTQIGIPNPNSSKTPTYQVDNIVGWRNFATIQPDPSQFLGGNYDFHSAPLTGMRYHNFLLGVTNGFLSANPQPFPFPATMNSRTDQVFTSRQSLLKFRRSTGFSQNALQYLGTFSRDINAPTWSPSKVTGSTIDYETLKDNAASANRDLRKVRVVSPFVRSDGTTAQAGEPLLKRRFSLSRLAGLGPDGVVTTGDTTLVDGVLSPASARTIQRDFGLVWVKDHWEYWGPTGIAVSSMINVLGSVGNREPDFFELLKAGVLSGSLGRDAGMNGVYKPSGALIGPASGINSNDTNTDFQIIQMGANIIDQSDTDGYPTEIKFGSTGTTFYGIENIPYIQRIFGRALYHDTNYPAIADDKIYGWYMAELWNPHQSFGSSAGTTPTLFRLRAEGLTAMWTPNGIGGAESTSLGIKLEDSGSLEFTASTTDFREPILLSNINATTVDGPNGTNAPLKTGMVGLYSGAVPSTTGFGGMSPRGCDMIVEYSKTPIGPYKVYQRLKNLSGKQQGDATKMAFYYHHPDPRTGRFGTSLGRWTFGSASTYSPGKSIRPTTDTGQLSSDYIPQPSAAGFIYQNSPSQGCYLGTLSDNIIDSNLRYMDQDGILRSAEGNYSNGNNGRPLILGNATSRPIILNRPFRNVGELGYTFRDLPWKNIDFFTTNSGDAGLLDIFSVSETTSEHTMVAGRVNLNTRQATVLQSIVAGAVKNEIASPVSVVSDTDAATIGNNVVAWTGSPVSGRGPFVNRSELLTGGGAVLQGSGTNSTAMADQQIKTRREAALRALSEVSTTRTWNLMIDVIAQSGRYAPGETNLKSFVVSGEKRYWLHVAIDRYTGEVIDRILESVNE